MINLDGTLSRLRLVTSGTSQITVTASWADLLSGAVTPGETNTSITTAATTVIVAAPAASTVRGLKSMFIRNSGGSANTITLQRFDGTTAYPIRSLTLAAGEVLACDEGNWYYLSAAGYTYTAVNTSLADGNYGDVIVSASGSVWALDYTSVNPVVAPVWGNITSKPAAVTSLSGTNTGDQTSIVGITGTKAQFNTAMTDGDFQFFGDPPTMHLHDQADINNLLTDLSNKQATLISTTNIKSINGVTILGAGDLAVVTDLTYTASSRLLQSSSGDDVFLPLMSSANAGLVPASGGGTTNFLRADGTFAAPSGGGGGSYQSPLWSQLA